MFKVECNYAIKLDKEINTVATVESEKKFMVQTVNAYGENFSTLGELMELINGKYSNKHHHPLTGPINIKGAEPGDVLKVMISEINIGIMGQALSKSAGIDPIDVNMFGDRAPIIATHQHHSSYIDYVSNMKIRYRPMIGMIGTAPSEGFIKTGHAGKTGGNLDIPFLTTGTAVYLPVQVEGGKLFLGDVHGSQGYGELGGVALEASSDIVLTVEVLKPRKEFNCMVVVGEEPLTSRDAIGVIGVADKMGDVQSSILDAYTNTVHIMGQLFNTYNDNIVRNMISAFGHSMMGQAFSKTSESTSIINIYKDDIALAKGIHNYNLREEFDSILFKS